MAGEWDGLLLGLPHHTAKERAVSNGDSPLAIAKGLQSELFNHLKVKQENDWGILGTTPLVERNIGD